MRNEVDECSNQKEWDEKPVKAVAKECSHTFPLDAFDDEESGDQEHQRHEKYVVEVFEDIQTNPPCIVNNGMR
ncbi:hypothetical protein D3C86_2113350 [compost metagenome]